MPDHNEMDRATFTAMTESTASRLAKNRDGRERLQRRAGESRAGSPADAQRRLRRLFGGSAGAFTAIGVA